MVQLIKLAQNDDVPVIYSVQQIIRGNRENLRIFFSSPEPKAPGELIV